MNRRTFIAAAGAGSAALLAGCTGDDGEEPDGEWEFRARIENQDDQSREWRVEARSDGGNVAAAYSTLPAGETTEVGLVGRRRGEDVEIYAESDNGAQAQPWDPSECRFLFADITISGGEPSFDTECREA